MPSKDKIEERAVETIRSLINNCDFITHDIPTNDKTPVYDGELRLYRKNSKGLSNENLIGAGVCQEFCVNRFNKQHRIAA